MIAINSSTGELFVSGVVDREHLSLISTDGVFYIIVKVNTSFIISITGSTVLTPICKVNGESQNSTPCKI